MKKYTTYYVKKICTELCTDIMKLISHSNHTLTIIYYKKKYFDIREILQIRNEYVIRNIAQIMKYILRYNMYLMIFVRFSSSKELYFLMLSNQNIGTI